jgi:hypothetical protein
LSHFDLDHLWDQDQESSKSSSISVGVEITSAPQGTPEAIANFPNLNLHDGQNEEEERPPKEPPKEVLWQEEAESDT